MSADERGNYLGADDALDFGDDLDDEPCYHDCDDDCYDDCDQWECRHMHCFACGGCGCPGYCDDYQTYNLRPAETGGDDDGPA